MLSTDLLRRLLQPNANVTVMLDDHAVDKIGKDELRLSTVDPGEHRLCPQFVGLRRSEELTFTLKQDEERQFPRGTE